MRSLALFLLAVASSLLTPTHASVRLRAEETYARQQAVYLKAYRGGELDDRPSPAYARGRRQSYEGPQTDRTRDLARENTDEWTVLKRHAHGQAMHGGSARSWGMRKLRRAARRTTSRATTTLSGATRLDETTLSKRGGGVFKGVSSYYLFALDDGPRRKVLDAIKGGGFSVVRIFLAGVGANNKGSGNPAVPDLEPDKVGEYDDTILYKIDKLMADCADRGLKLMIALSDRYALGFWSTNAYAIQLSIVPSSKKGGVSLKYRNAHSFYTNPWAIEMFEKRVDHALNHRNDQMGGQKWKDLSSVIYAFEAQNEPQGYMDLANPSWVCDRSNHIASLVSGSGIQISSGGGIDISKSLQPWATDCGSIDIVSVHDYGTNGYSTAAALARAKANHPDKTIMMGEWGLTGTDKAAKISKFVSAFEDHGIPWMYWQVTNPGAGSADFEVWTDEPSWGVLTGGSYSSPPPGAVKIKSSSSSGSDASTLSSSPSSPGASTASDDGTFSTVTDAGSHSTITDSAADVSGTSRPWSSSSRSRQSGKSRSSWFSKGSSTASSDASTTLTSSDAQTTPTSSDASPSESNSSYDYSTVSLDPTDLGDYVTLSEEEIAALSLSVDGQTSLGDATSSSDSSSSDGPTSTSSGDSSQTASITGTPTLTNWVPSPTDVLPLPNCNFTLADLDGVEPDVNSTVRLLPSGIICNSTVLPEARPSDATRTDSSGAPSESPLFVFSLDPSFFHPDSLATATGDPAEGEAVPTEATESSPVEPTPPAAEDYTEVTLDAADLATMNIDDYVTVS
ncbi:hypothetical protein JCM10212_001863 [Sporobolomyces blumeae]